MTQKWFEHDAENYKLFISVITIEEIDQLKNTTKRDNISQLLIDNNVQVLELGDEARKIANEYIKRGAIPKSEPEDALHVAIATVNKMEALVSWNFKHIVSMGPIKKIHEINKKLNYAIIEIGSLEIFWRIKIWKLIIMIIKSKKTILFGNFMRYDMLSIKK